MRPSRFKAISLLPIVWEYLNTSLSFWVVKLALYEDYIKLMDTKKILNWLLPFDWLKFLLITLLVLGVFFRFINIDKKIYWRDEALTSLQISGYTQTEVLQQAFNGSIMTVADLQKYQQIKPNSSVLDTVKSLAVETPEHPPLYYMMSRLWVQCFGSSVAAIRSLSVILSLLVFPAIFWLCLELFESPLVGWIAMAIVAVSPFHVLYAQEAREYSFWTVTILLSSAALLRAMRFKTKHSWGVYAFHLALGFYSYLFFAFVAVSHGIYTIITERFKLTKTLVAYLLAALSGFLFFIPWAVVVITNLAQLKKSMSWISYRFTFLELATRWIFNINRIFVDWNYGFSFNSAFPYLVIISILVLSAYSLYFVWRNTTERQWLFIFTLIGVTASALVIPDLISGGQRSRVLRYIIPCYLGVQLAVAYLFATKINSTSLKNWQQKSWQVIMVLVLTSGVASCVISSQAVSWWNKSGIDNTQLVMIINKAPKPIVISDTSLPSDILSFTYGLNQDVRIQLVTQPDLLKISNVSDNMFLYNPSKALKTKIERENKYKIKQLQSQLFKVDKI
jgi:uncharacterized membrane protein